MIRTPRFFNGNLKLFIVVLVVFFLTTSLLFFNLGFESKFRQNMNIVVPACASYCSVTSANVCSFRLFFVFFTTENV